MDGLIPPGVSNALALRELGAARHEQFGDHATYPNDCRDRTLGTCLGSLQLQCRSAWLRGSPCCRRPQRRCPTRAAITEPWPMAKPKARSPVPSRSSVRCHGSANLDPKQAFVACATKACLEAVFTTTLG